MARLSEPKIDADKNKIFSEVFENDFVRLCYYANNFLSDIDVCKDIVQDVFISIWEAKDINISGSDLSKLLFRSVRNRCLDHLKGQKVRNNYKYSILQKIADYSDSDYTSYEIKELSDKITVELNNLPKQTYDIFQMSRVGGKTYSDIAETLGVSIKTVEFHMSKALAALRKGLKEYLPLLVSFMLFL
jgi:RNA polymerase sigma-70 factor (ECF subfamily)